VYETAAAIVVEADLPGVREDQLEILVGEGFVTLRSAEPTEPPKGKRRYHLRERRIGPFCRDIPLPQAVVAVESVAHLVDGKLRMILPKDPGAKARLQRLPLT